MSKFALIGASGYIAPRHVEAIKYTDNELVALLDPYDGIGYIDRHYPNASYFSHTAAVAGNGGNAAESDAATIFPRGMTIYGRWSAVSMHVADTDGGLIAYYSY